MHREDYWNILKLLGIVAVVRTAAWWCIHIALKFWLSFFSQNYAMKRLRHSSE
jgi:hypothetical protein